MKKIPGTYLVFLIWFLSGLTVASQVKWEHISSTTGAIKVPNRGKQQTSAAVADFSKPAWPRYVIRNTGGNKVHDQIVGDFDGDNKPDLVFWAQGDQTLYFSRIPADPVLTENWKLIPIYKYYGDSQMEQHGTYPAWKR
ncbi:MAG TPA: hypothetical protein PLB27_14735, partial [Bacteroidales bacterium]|nr:hypothetical protein [Bacteroidales bacterium]